MYVVYCIHSQLPVINQSSVTCCMCITFYIHSQQLNKIPDEIICCMCITFYIHSQLPDQEALWRSWLYVHHILHTLTTLRGWCCPQSCCMCITFYIHSQLVLHICLYSNMLRTSRVLKSPVKALQRTRIYEM
jgi:hypothetical protein